MVKSMNAALRMSPPTTFGASPSVISSPALGDGPTPLLSQDGEIYQYGRAHALANLSARQAREQGLLTSGTCGLLGFTSSRSAALASSLASRLRVRTDCLGSTLFKLTWKTRVTPMQRSIYALRASVLRKPDSGCTSWPTPMAGTPAQNGNNMAGNTDSSRKTVKLAGWPAPKASNTTGAGTRGEGGPNLQTAVLGVIATGSHARTDGPGQLNPAHSRWLMGYPHVWDESAVTAMPSSRTKRPSSSARTSMPKTTAQQRD